MKAIMYHYIRNKRKDFPYSNILTINDFKNQVNEFNNIGLIKKYDELFIPNNKIICTFDDGFKDNLYAAEILKKYNATGIFFIPTSPYLKNEILDVHKVHLICGKVHGLEIMKTLNDYLTKNKIFNYFNSKEKEIFKNVYNNQDDNIYKKEFKKIMNYYGSLNLSGKILNYLTKYFNINFKAKSFYLSKKEIKYMQSIGMIIGCHSHSHILLSRLNYKKQFREISKSKSLLERIIKNKVDIFCYPYGGKKSYNSTTINILKQLNFKQSYSVGNNDITKSILKKKFELPRYDCNYFLN
jgi:peptidoglycan/xylan/chitin deacetylase (PgdA/CDA1 family)